MMAKMDQKRDPERMQCMEVWGGNVRVERHFQMRGLEAWISSQPEGQAAAGGDVTICPRAPWDESPASCLPTSAATVNSWPEPRPASAT